jgi:hypothetical protein
MSEYSILPFDNNFPLARKYKHAFLDKRPWHRSLRPAEGVGGEAFVSGARHGCDAQLGGEMLALTGNTSNRKTLGKIITPN